MDMSDPAPPGPGTGTGSDSEPAPSTGHPTVDAAVERLGDLDERSPDEHVEVYEGIDESLRSVLDGEPGNVPEAPGR